MQSIDIFDLGWSPEWEDAARPWAEQGLVPARVAVQQRGSYVLLTDHGEMTGELPGRFLYEASASSVPAAGDWVMVEPLAGEAKAIVRAVLPRRTRFARKVAGVVTEEQVVAANADHVFVMSSLNQELNLRRIERYLTTAWESGAAPVVVLTKSDLSDDVAEAMARVEGIAPGVPVHAVSAMTGEGIDDLRVYLGRGVTVALLGSSGVGKSTLANELAGRPLLKVRDVRWDDKGRHTTTHRELVSLPGGGLVLDTPGMRELQLWDAQAGLAGTFEDIVALAAGCRFSDCTHGPEPACAVTQAVRDGRFDEGRLTSYHKLQRELQYLARRQDKRAASEEKRKFRALQRSLRHT